MQDRSFKAAALASAALFSLAFTPMAESQDAPAAAQLEIMIDGLRTDRGRVWVGLYASQSDWDAQTETAQGWALIEDGVARVRLAGLPSGDVALQAFHDANGNNDFDTNFLGIPQERYGFSNNPRPKFRGANWEEAVIELAPGEVRDLTISLQGARG
ncbi:DUF2141 domain-containing protein [Oceanicaulis alexandrii]|uniref:DUF2141 domain-containing protein n=1 Tax=Oceanicaulis alexandrii TaxID=153233 RepID=UPI0035D06EB3